ncbi:MAG TPA: iron ABC transporter permease, partial [Sphaerochaeta sp.]|nr:iron ABC transporter permease [Sphaerochaeta sp.]
ALSLGLSAFTGFPIAALLGSTLTTLLILAHSYSRRGSTTTLLLTGVALNYILSALMTLLLFMNQEQYQRILYWSLGSFSSATWTHVRMLALLAAFVMSPLALSHRSLDLLLLDDASALASGLSVRRVRLAVLLPASIATAICVSFFGVIGFIGLVAPHISRLLVGPKHSRLLPAASLFGGILLLGSDTLARILLPSGELPVGVITSLLGVPLFLYLLRSGRYRYE